MGKGDQEKERGTAEDGQVQALSSTGGERKGLPQETTAQLGMSFYGKKLPKKMVNWGIEVRYSWI